MEDRRLGITCTTTLYFIQPVSPLVAPRSQYQMLEGNSGIEDLTEFDCKRIEFESIQVIVIARSSGRYPKPWLPVKAPSLELDSVRAFWRAVTAGKIHRNVWFRMITQVGEWSVKNHGSRKIFVNFTDLAISLVSVSIFGKAKKVSEYRLFVCFILITDLWAS